MVERWRLRGRGGAAGPRRIEGNPGIPERGNQLRERVQADSTRLHGAPLHRRRSGPTVQPLERTQSGGRAGASPRHLERHHDLLRGGGRLNRRPSAAMKSTPSARTCLEQSSRSRAFFLFTL